MDSIRSRGGGSRKWTVEQVGKGAAGSGQYNKWGRGSREWTIEQVGEGAAGSGQ